MVGRTRKNKKYKKHTKKNFKNLNLNGLIYSIKVFTVLNLFKL